MRLLRVRLPVCLFCITLSALSIAQKPALTLDVLEHFPKWSTQAGISKDGGFCFYVLNNAEQHYTTLTIRSLNDAYIFELSHLPPDYWAYIAFTPDGKRAVFINPGDSLCILNLQAHAFSYLPDCSRYNFAKEGEGRWLAAVTKDHALHLLDLQTGLKKSISNVVSHEFSPNGKVLVVQTKNKNELATLEWIDLANNKSTTFWRGNDASTFTFDQNANALAFAVTDTLNGKPATSLFYYKSGGQVSCVMNQNMFNDSSLVVTGTGLQLSKLGNKLFFFYKKERPMPTLPDSMADVDVWNYKDDYLQSEQLFNIGTQQTHVAAISIPERRLIRLETEVNGFPTLINENKNGDFVIVRTKGNFFEEYRRTDQRPDIFLMNTINGERNKLIGRVKDSPLAGIHFSPTGKFVCWYDTGEQTYCTYNLQTNQLTNVSREINVPLYHEVWDYTRKPDRYSKGLVWLNNDEAFLVYDRYDIWKVYPDGKKKPVNITRSFGRQNRIVFRLIYSGSSIWTNTTLKVKSDMVVCAFNEVSKQNGFFTVDLKGKKAPVQLSMSDSVYYFSDNFSFAGFSTFIEKAKEKNVYLLRQESSSDFPNYVVTSDFKEFRQLTHVAPHKKYNWLTAELVNYTTFSGKPSTGILYKPEDFDSTKKYPVIVYFYERYSDGINNFLTPEVPFAAINIPLMVSKGYLVFYPDIKYTIAAPGESAYDHVVSGVRHIMKNPWIDTTKMGVQGHSFGGYEVNYLITRTNLFAAAESGAGDVNLISASGDVAIKGGIDGRTFFENGQYRMKKHLWEIPDAYIKNSPVFYLDKIQTPLLIMHNKGDGTVDFSQAAELFTGLRRLGKKVWMLQYDNEQHTLMDPKNQRDFAIRIQQYFDHYLKGAPPPVWMTRGIPASRKRIDTGYEYETENINP